MVFNHIQDFQSLTATEKILASFINEYPVVVLDSSLKDLSDQLFISQSTIIRFCKKINLKGFSDLKVQLSSELSKIGNHSGVISSDFPFEENATSTEIAESFLGLAKQTLSLEFESLNFSKIKEAASLIHQSDMLYIYGRGTSLIVAEDFHYKLMRIGKTSIIEPLSGFSEARNFNYKKENKLNKVALVVSAYSSSEYIRAIINDLQEKSIPFIFLSGSDTSSTYKKLATVHIQIQSTESRFKMGSFKTKYAMLYILDYLYGELFNINYENNKKNLATFIKERIDWENF